MARIRVFLVLLLAVGLGGTFALATYRYIQNLPAREVALPTTPVVVDGDHDLLHRAVGCFSQVDRVLVSRNQQCQLACLEGPGGFPVPPDEGDCDGDGAGAGGD